MTIKDYISTSRKLLNKPINRERYESILNELHQGRRIDLKLLVIFSLNRKTEIAEHDKIKYLIYDQYLGQTFYELNRIYFGAPRDEIGLCYTFKLVGENLQLRNYLNASLFFAHYFTNFHPYFKEIKPYEKEVVMFTTIQEYFVIAHEISHDIVANYVDEDLFETTKKLLTKNHLDVFDKIDLTEQSITDSYVDSLMKTMRFPEELRETVQEQSEIVFEGGLEEYIDKTRNLVNNRRDFLEEVICDEIATNMVLNLNLTSPETTIRAIHIGLFNLRLLSIADRMVDQIKDKSQSITDYFFESNIRLNAFRKNFETTFKHKYNKPDLESFLNFLEKDTERYSTLIADQLLFTTQTDINEVSKQPKLMNRKFKSKERKEINNLINKAFR